MGLRVSVRPFQSQPVFWPATQCLLELPPVSLALGRAMRPGWLADSELFVTCFLPAVPSYSGVKVLREPSSGSSAYKARGARRASTSSPRRLRCSIGLSYCDATQDGDREK